MQGEILNFGDDTPQASAVKPDTTVKSDTVKPNTAKPDKKTSDGDQRMGSALRSVYQKTVDEAVPDEMLALLGKLG